ncbi:DEAD/DEAH box helicase [Ophiocordyceps camponoti-floridani]|uniref:DEAD/DEAH box helicase n=1 Tax=Ophiocordyceps camponoti-floridani TaxID=2030778 RepID=A0A8H4VDF8_9HYPO|nr:DEAD/DEAH box helicase [Ophiocordyceps camponoti-floridani]
MCDNNQRASPKSDRNHTNIGEDAEMRAARRELKQSSISDPSASDQGTEEKSTAGDNADSGLSIPVESGCEASTEDPVDVANGDSKPNASPKKKRAHDQLDADRKAQEDDTTSIASTDSAKDRSSRLEPEKKRHRDHDYVDSNPTDTSADTNSTVPAEEVGVETSCANSPKQAADAPEVRAKSPIAAADSSSKSDVATLVEHGPPSSSSVSVKSPIAPRKTGVPSAPKLTFGSNGGVSPFAALSSSSNGFATRSRSGDGFASAFSGVKPLSSFAAFGGPPLQVSKAAKPFGAPDAGSEDEEVEVLADPDGVLEEPPRCTSPDKDTDDKKKARLQKVEIDDGEAEEVSIVSVRAKMFSLDKDVGWKERGAGMLKINVPRVCVEMDEAGVAIPGSFDASALEAHDKTAIDGKGQQMVRLIMRQDQTHRVILNTVVVPAMQFQQKATLKSVGVLFTAFEGEDMKPVSITMRMSAANAKVFMRDIEMVQKQLRRE